MADQYKFEEYVKPIDVPQLPSEPASTFKPIDGYSKETNAERDTEAPTDDEADILAEDSGLSGE